MATLTLIGEPLPGLESAAHAQAARDLTEAVALTAPRGCSARLLVANGSEIPTFQSPRARTETLPMKAGMLPLLWRNGATARPLDDEFVHAVTPLVPLRARNEEDSSQTSVMVPHAFAWTQPELMGTAQARIYRSYVKRALRLADSVLTPTHAVAEVLFSRYGFDLPVQVLPLAAPTGIGRPKDAADAAARREALELPARYVATTATMGEHGRLGWLLDAMAADPELPPLVVLLSAPLAAPLREDLQGRVIAVQPRELADIGAVLEGALLFACPQEHLGTGYEVLGALDNAVPVLHGGCPVAAELALDAGVATDSAGSFAHELTRLVNDDAELARLRVLAEDRSRSYAWVSTAWQLWELHASL